MADAGPSRIALWEVPDIKARESTVTEQHYRKVLRDDGFQKKAKGKKDWSYNQPAQPWARDKFKVQGPEPLSPAKNERNFRGALRPYDEAKDVGAESMSAQQVEKRVEAGKTKVTCERRLYQPSARAEDQYFKSLRPYEWDKDQAHVSPTKQRYGSMYRQAEPKSTTLTPAMANKTFHGSLRGNDQKKSIHKSDWQ
tara:strand:+ start:76 stop:663 length:588 start_codon:yes stop_codon:yes gene_type:complete